MWAQTCQTDAVTLTLSAHDFGKALAIIGEYEQDHMGTSPVLRHPPPEQSFGDTCSLGWTGPQSNDAWIVQDMLDRERVDCWVSRIDARHRSYRPFMLWGSRFPQRHIKVWQDKQGLRQSVRLGSPQGGIVSRTYSHILKHFAGPDALDNYYNDGEPQLQWAIEVQWHPGKTGDVGEHWRGTQCPYLSPRAVSRGGIKQLELVYKRKISLLFFYTFSRNGQVSKPRGAACMLWGRQEHYLYGRGVPPPWEAGALRGWKDCTDETDRLDALLLGEGIESSADYGNEQSHLPPITPYMDVKPALHGPAATA